MNARDYLEFLQKCYYGQEERQERTEEYYRQFLERAASAWARSDSEKSKVLAELKSTIEGDKALRLPTKYEDPHTYAILMELATAIEESAKELNQSLSSPVVVGTLPTGRVNAMAIAIPSSNEHLVLFESELFEFALLLTKVIAQAMPAEEVKGGFKLSRRYSDIDERINDEEIKRRFRELIFAYIAVGKPSMAEQYFTDVFRREIGSLLLESLELFVVAHEYGHVIANHLTNSAHSKCQLVNSEVNELTFNWAQEFEADSIGLALMTNATQKRGRNIDVAYWGADVFFTGIDVLERALATFLTGRENFTIFSSHPPATIRREYLRYTVRQHLQTVHAGPVRIAMQTQYILEELWASLHPFIVHLHTEGYKPSPRWHQQVLISNAR